MTNKWITTEHTMHQNPNKSVIHLQVFKESVWTAKRRSLLHTHERKFETCDRALSKCLFRPTLMHLILIQNKHMLLIGKNHKSVQQLKIMLPWLWGQARKTCNAYLTLSFKKVHFCMKHWRTLTLANCHSSFIFLLLGLLKKCTQCPSNATTGH